ncbi:MAG: hypothetical protein K8I03_06925 [Ignavibacteria bacterium]|nr:hypothetical protein [Ignavibacteria bacterium]
MSKIRINLCLIIIFNVLNSFVFAQENNELTGQKDLISMIRSEIKDSETGCKLEEWYRNLKKNNIKIKLIFDETGFILSLKMVSLSKKLFRDSDILNSEDVSDIINFTGTLERLGCQAPSGLINSISYKLNVCIGKNGSEIIEIIGKDN